MKQKKIQIGRPVSIVGVDDEPVPVEGDADDGEGGDEAEEDGQDPGEHAQHRAHRAWGQGSSFRRILKKKSMIYICMQAEYNVP